MFVLVGSCGSSVRFNRIIPIYPNRIASTNYWKGRGEEEERGGAGRTYQTWREGLDDSSAEIIEKVFWLLTKVDDFGSHCILEHELELKEPDQDELPLSVELDFQARYRRTVDVLGDSLMAREIALTGYSEVP
ncbi:hypothetical protein Tco_1391515 [Tanacetum coccineum]